MEIAINRSKAVMIPQSTIDSFPHYHRGFAWDFVRLGGPGTGVKAFWSACVLDLRNDFIHDCGQTGVDRPTQALARADVIAYIDAVIAETRAL